MNGKQVQEKLQGLTDGESLLVDGAEWTSLGYTFAVESADPDAKDDDTTYVPLDDLDDYFSPETEYEVI